MGEAIKKSGIRSFQQGEIIFKENDPAESLFIIQKGQIRLFRPKGRGFVEIAILRAGEVIGEMAYFDANASRRSCSAEALVGTEVVEISFKAFSKTMEGLNPWFKTIINTLASRLRKTNEKVKELESNSVGPNRAGKLGDYKFFINSDVVRFLSVLYLSFKSHGGARGSAWTLHLSTLKFYAQDVFSISEIKYEEFLEIVKGLALVHLELDEKGLPKALVAEDLEIFRSMLIFFNTQSLLEDAKKLIIPPKTENFLRHMIEDCEKEGKTTESSSISISKIQKIFELKGERLREEDLTAAIELGLAEEIMINGEGELSTVINYPKVKKLLPSIGLMNAIAKKNDAKKGANF